MTAARRALPPRPTALQRLAALLTGTQGIDALVSALEDHADRLDQRARRCDQLGQHYVAHAHRTGAGEIRTIISRHQP